MPFCFCGSIFRPVVLPLRECSSLSSSPPGNYVQYQIVKFCGRIVLTLNMPFAKQYEEWIIVTVSFEHYSFEDT